MDLNLVVICGRLATEPEIKTFETGTRLIRMLVTVRTETPRRRVDVIPVTIWDPSDELVAGLITDHARGQRVWVCGSAQRRFWEAPDGRRSRLEIVAEQVNVMIDEEVLA